MKRKYLTVWPSSPVWLCGAPPQHTGTWPEGRGPGQSPLLLPGMEGWVTPSCQLIGASHCGHDSFQNQSVHIPAAHQSHLPKVSREKGPSPLPNASGPLGGLGHGDPQSWLVSRQSRSKAGRMGSGARLLRSKSRLRHLLATCPGTDYAHTVPTAPQGKTFVCRLPCHVPAPAGCPALSEHTVSCPPQAPAAVE